jgi:hypothetical protein
LTIHEERAIAPSQPLPPDARFNAYREFVVQDLEILPHNTRYRLEVWQTPDGQWLRGELPASLDGAHFVPGLRIHLLYQYHRCHVTQPFLRE